MCFMCFIGFCYRQFWQNNLDYINATTTIHLNLLLYIIMFLNFFFFIFKSILNVPPRHLFCLQTWVFFLSSFIYYQFFISIMRKELINAQMKAMSRDVESLNIQTKNCTMLFINVYFILFFNLCKFQNLGWSNYWHNKKQPAVI